MKDTLTTAELELIPVIRDERINKLNNPKPIDRDAATPLIERLYGLAGLKKPQVVYADSPYGAQVCANMLQGEQVRDQVRDQVEAQVLAQVRDQVEAQVIDQVGAQVRDQVKDKVRAQVRDQVGDKVLVQVRDQVEAQVIDQVRAKKIEYYSFASYANISDFGRLAYHSFFKKIGIVKDNNFDKFVQLMECGIYDMIQLDGLCVVCGMPSVLKRDDKHRMNNTEGYAIEWADGYGQHYIHGIYFDDEAREVFKDKDVKQIINRANQDQKRAMIMELDYAQMLTELNAELVNEMLDDDKNIMRLYKIDLGDDEEPGLFYEAIDPSKNEKIVLRVAPNVGIETALQAKIRTWKHLRDWVQQEKGNTIKFLQET